MSVLHPITVTAVTGPDGEPVTLAEAKQHLRVDGSDEDGLILALIATARQVAEHYLGLALMTRVVDASYAKFGDLRLPRLATAVQSVSYLDTADVSQILATTVYHVSLGEQRIVHQIGQSWPALSTRHEPVSIRVAVGYASRAKVPTSIKQAMLLMIGHWHENREITSPLRLQQVPLSATALLNVTKVWL